MRYDNDDKVARYFTDAVDRLREPSGRDRGRRDRQACRSKATAGRVTSSSRAVQTSGVANSATRSITPGYFAGCRHAAVAGRDFATGDTSTGQIVVIVNQTLARRFFGDTPSRRPADRIQSSLVHHAWWTTIVGVVADEKQDGAGRDGADRRCTTAHAGHAKRCRSIVRTAVPVGVRAAAHPPGDAAVDPAVAHVRHPHTRASRGSVAGRGAVRDRWCSVLSRWRRVLLAVIGLYGIVAFAVTSRTREIGLRLALGASRQHVLRMVVWDGRARRADGTGGGIGRRVGDGPSGSRASCSRRLRPIRSCCVAVAAILGAAGALCQLRSRARRASRVDPVESLRTE